MTHIRQANAQDLPVLADIYAASYNPLPIGEAWDTAHALTLMEYFFQQQPDLFFVAEVDGVVVGAIVAMVKPWWDGNHLIDGELFVDPRQQKKGVGATLLRTLLEEGQKRYNTLSWDTFTHIVNEHPLKWYQKVGFEKILHWAMITGDTKKVLTTLSK